MVFKKYKKQRKTYKIKIRFQQMTLVLGCPHELNVVKNGQLWAIQCELRGYSSASYELEIQSFSE